MTIFFCCGAADAHDEQDTIRHTPRPILPDQILCDSTLPGFPPLPEAQKLEDQRRAADEADQKLEQDSRPISKVPVLLAAHRKSRTELVVDEESSLPCKSPEHRRTELVWPNGTRYSGEVLGIKRDGEGRQEWPDGAVYEGQWLSDVRHGRGVLRHDGSAYEGQWCDDKAHGRGTFTRRDGHTYSGEWADDEQEGQGTELWPDGTQYVGQQVGGQKHGHGRLTWKDGTSFEGVFVQDSMSKDGIINFPRAAENGGS